jgi:ABC-type transport system involved in cytochrome bd biosynthesis fused ATPase/permease subunit
MLACNTEPCDTKVKPMALIIGVVSQKGGVGKSTIARLIARELAAQDWEVKIADLDISQATSYHWRAAFTTCHGAGYFHRAVWPRRSGAEERGAL